MKKQQEERKELEGRLTAKDEEINTLKLLSEQASQTKVIEQTKSNVEDELLGNEVIYYDRNNDSCGCPRFCYWICFRAVCVSIHDEVAFFVLMCLFSESF